MERKFWRSEIFRVWVQYLAAGIAAIPGGIVYAVLLDHSTKEKLAFQIALFLAVGSGLVAWFGVGRLMRNAQPLMTVLQASSSNVAWNMGGGTPVLACGSLALVMISSLGPHHVTIRGVIGQETACASPTTSPRSWN